MCRSFRLIRGFLALTALFLLPGCRTWVEKSTLPGKRYLEHPPQYIAPSPIQPLPNEAQTPVPTLPPALDSTFPSLPGPQTKPRPQVKDPYVAELIDLISQTKSVDAFLVSVSLLAEAKAEARQVVPAVIRNAERLGIYGRYAIEEKAKGAEVAKQLTELIGKMIKGKTETLHKKSANTGANPKPNSDEPCAPGAENSVENVKYPILPPVSSSDGSQSGNQKNPANRDKDLSMLWKILEIFQGYSADPNIRMEQMLMKSGDPKQIQEEWRRFWMDNQPAGQGNTLSVAPVSNTTPTPGKRTQVRFVKPAGMKVSWFGVGPDGKPTPKPNVLEVPGRYNFTQGAIYRLALSNIEGRPGLEIFPTLEVVPSNAKTEAFLAHNAVPIEFTQDDFKRVLASEFLVKVIYLPHPKFQDFNGSTAEIISTKLKKGADPIQEALRRGSILVVLRMGSIDPKMPNRFQAGQ